jgi:hypothetical protein
VTRLTSIALFAAERPILCLLAGFLTTFLLTRGVTCLIRAQRGPFANLAVGDLHLHHMVWGAWLALASGIAQFAFMPGKPWNAVLAVAFGVGSALMLDEFALMVYLRDVYWSDEGRRSIDAVITMLVAVGMLAIPVAPALMPASVGLPIVVGAGLAYVALIATCLLKGKTFTALAGVFLPILLPIGAARLARPGSPWALVRYRRNPPKERRSARRFHPAAPHERVRQRALAVLGGTVAVAEPREAGRPS